MSNDGGLHALYPACPHGQEGKGSQTHQSSTANAFSDFTSRGRCSPRLAAGRLSDVPSETAEVLVCFTIVDRRDR